MMKKVIATRFARLRRQKRKAFTLVELIVVIVILGILLAISLPALTGYIAKAQDQGLKADAAAIRIACQSIGSEQYSVNLTTTKLSDAQLAAATGATITPTASDTAKWFEGINKLAGSNYSGTLRILYGPGNTIIKFAYTASPPDSAQPLTSDADAKWAYYDGSSWTIVVGNGASSPLDFSPNQPKT